MGFRFRKSVKVGPARVNLSKSGVGFSIGTKGARISKSANGEKRATFGIPGTGVSYSQKIGGRKSATKRSSQKSGPGTLQSILTLAAVIAIIYFVIKYRKILMYLAIAAAVVLAAVLVYKVFKKRKASSTEAIDCSVDTMASNSPSAQNPIAPKEPAIEVKTYQVAGVEHYMDTLLSLARPNDLYNYKKQELIDTCHYDESIYKQTVDAEHLELIHEPDNPFDPNAIKVLLDGNLVGYIAAKDCKHILDIMDNDLFVSAVCEVSGGKYKRVNEDYDCIKDKSTYKMETGEDPYSITIYIRERTL